MGMGTRARGTLKGAVASTVLGAGLAISGAALQALFRNPLAEPGLIGISAGASLGAVIAIVMTHGGFWYTAPGAFIGCLAATLSASSRVIDRYSNPGRTLSASLSLAW